MPLALDRQALGAALLVGLILQLAMVIVGHWVAAIASLFAVLGVSISLVAGLLYAVRAASASAGAHALGGAIAGGGCALAGIAVSWSLGDVTAAILVVGTLSSTVTGALGGLIGRMMARGRAAAA